MERVDEIESVAQAVRWISAVERERALALERAAEQYRLACQYGLGDGVERDIDKAVLLLRQAAYGRDGPAQLCRGKSLEYTGCGVVRQ